jgi:hypothetical protein
MPTEIALPKKISTSLVPPEYMQTESREVEECTNRRSMIKIRVQNQ